MRRVSVRNAMYHVASRIRGIIGTGEIPRNGARPLRILRYRGGILSIPFLRLAPRSSAGKDDDLPRFSKIMDSAIGDISNPPCVSKFRKLAGVGDAVLNSERSCLMGTSLQKVRAADIIAFWSVSGAPSTMGPAFPALIGENSIASQGDIVEAPPLYSTLRAWGAIIHLRLV